MFVGLIKTMRRTFLLYSVILLCFAGVFNANAQTTDLLASKDNTIYSDGDSSNGSGSFLFVGTTSIGFERRALVRFDLSSLTPTDSVISAQLQMFVSKTKYNTETLYFYRLTNDWGESGSVAPYEEGGGTGAFPGDATWNYAFYDTAAWKTPGGDLDPVPSDSEQVGNTGSYTWSGAGLLTDINYWIKNPEQNFGWILIIPIAQPSTKRFNSRENADNPPKLVIQTLAQQSSFIQQTEDNNFSIYPNPTHGEILISEEGGSPLKSIRVLDLMGSTILAVSENAIDGSVQKITLNAKGCYYIVINNSIYRKVIVY